MVESSSLRAQLNTISTSADPAAQYIECFIEEIPATSSRAAHSVIKIKCTICQGIKTWSSWNRIRAHLTGDDTMALANGTTRCTDVTDEVAHQFKTIVREAGELSRRRSATRRSEAAVDAASATAARPASSKQQRTLENAFAVQSRESIDEKVAACFYANDISFAITSSTTFKRMIEALKSAPAPYVAPKRHRFTADLLEKAETRTAALKVPAFEKMKVFGAVICVDAATVHGEPLVNCVTKGPTTKPIHLITINAKEHIAEGGSKDADFEADLTVREIRKTPDGGIHIVLITGDTASDEVLQAAMVIAVCPWISYHPCTTHVLSLFLKRIAKLARIAKFLEQCNEITDWFRGHHATLALLDKHVRVHFPRANVKRPFYAPDSRFAVQFLSALRHLELKPAYQSAVTDPVYAALNLKEDTVKPRVMDQEWWDDAYHISRIIYPIVRLLKLTDSHAPVMSKLCGRMLQVEEFASNYSPDESLSEELAEQYRELCAEVYEFDDNEYWGKIKSDFALAAWCLEPQFHHQKPWENEEAHEALMNVTSKLHYPLVGDAHDEARRACEAGYRVYFTKSGIFSKDHIWPRMKDGVVDSRDLIPAYEFFQSYGASMGPAQAIAIKIVGQVASATIAERDWKCYKNTVSKKRTGLGLERKDGSGSSGVRLTNVRANMHLDEFDDKDAHEEECFLRSFDIDEESKFAQMFFVAQNRHGIDAPAKKPFLCFLEDWEDPSGKALSDMKNRVTQFKLVEKYDGMFLYDDDEDEHRKIINVEWANRKGYQVVTQLVGSEADLEQNQGYLINSELPPLVAAGKNPEYKMIMSPAEAAALTAAQQPQPRRADDRGGDDVALAVQRTSAENLPLGAGGAPWQGE